MITVDAFTEYLKTRRTMTETEVFNLAAAHDAEDYRPTEREHVIDTQSLRELHTEPRKDHSTVLSG